MRADGRQQLMAARRRAAFPRGWLREERPRSQSLSPEVAPLEEEPAPVRHAPGVAHVCRACGAHTSEQHTQHTNKTRRKREVTRSAEGESLCTRTVERHVVVRLADFRPEVVQRRHGDAEAVDQPQGVEHRFKHLAELGRVVLVRVNVPAARARRRHGRLSSGKGKGVMNFARGPRAREE